MNVFPVPLSWYLGWVPEASHPMVSFPTEPFTWLLEEGLIFGSRWIQENKDVNIKTNVNCSLKNRFKASIKFTYGCIFHPRWGRRPGIFILLALCRRSFNFFISDESIKEILSMRRLNIASREVCLLSLNWAYISVKWIIDINLRGCIIPKKGSCQIRCLNKIDTWYSLNSSCLNFVLLSCYYPLLTIRLLMLTHNKGFPS